MLILLAIDRIILGVGIEPLTYLSVQSLTPPPQSLNQVCEFQ